jgi:hypothetical protein
MSNRAEDLVASCRAYAARPVLERLRFFEALPVLGADEAEAAIAAIERDDDTWVADALTKLLPGAYWIGRLDDATSDADRFAIDEGTRAVLGERYTAMLVDALLTSRAPGRLLAHLHASVTREPESLRLLGTDDGKAWSRVRALVTHDDPGARGLAARLAVAGKRFAPPVVEAMRETLARATAQVTDSYDDQVEGEEILGEIASAGAPLAALAPDVERVLGSASPAFRAMAAHAAAALGDAELRGALERHERAIDPSDDELVRGVRAMMRFARWRLGDDVEWLDAAMDDAGDSIVYLFRLARAFDDAPVDERLLAGLERAARRAQWHRLAYDALAKIGPPAAKVVARVTPETMPEDPDEAFSLRHARWRAKLDDDESFARGIEPLLDEAAQAWTSYVALDRGTDVSRHLVRRAIAAGDRSALNALLRSPAVGAQFLPDLLAAKRDAYVTALWRSLPREAFWSAVG